MDSQISEVWSKLDKNLLAVDFIVAISSYICELYIKSLLNEAKYQEIHQKLASICLTSLPIYIICVFRSVSLSLWISL